MPASFVPSSFDVPLTFSGNGFHLEPLGPVHNERDHEAWMTSIEHIKATPGMTFRKWPSPMTLDENLSDMEMHAAEFVARTGFTYSILDGDDVIGCVYIYPGDGVHDANVRSWVRESRSEMDTIVWRDLSEWLIADWPFTAIDYATRP
ncbi:MAG: N-acetyltransferase [Acidimicrobiia bacterium]